MLNFLFLSRYHPVGVRLFRKAKILTVFHHQWKAQWRSSSWKTSLAFAWFFLPPRAKNHFDLWVFYYLTEVDLLKFDWVWISCPFHESNRSQTDQDRPMESQWLLILSDYIKQQPFDFNHKTGLLFSWCRFTEHLNKLTCMYLVHKPLVEHS